MAEKVEKPTRGGRPGKNWSLKWKIPLATGIVIFVVVAVCYLELYHWQYHQFEKLIQMEAEAVSTIIRHSFEEKMEEGKVHNLSDLFRTLSKLDTIHCIRVFDPTGRIRLAGRPENVGRTISPPERESYERGEAVSVRSHEDGNLHLVTYVTEAVILKETCKRCHNTPMHEGTGTESLPAGAVPYWIITGENGTSLEVGGILSIGTHPSRIVETWSRESAIIARDFLMITLVFVVTLPMILWWMVTRRIVYLVRKMKQAEEGNLDAIAHVLPGDEIGELGESFNRLLKGLSDARKELEEAHNRQLYHMERLSTVGELAVRVAHEIKNPIAGIALGVEMLRRKDLSSEQIQDTVQEIHHQIQRLDRVTRNLLNFSRSHPSEMKPCSVCEILRHVQQFVNLESGEDSPQVGITCMKEHSLLYGDAKLLEQAFLNLVLNAHQAGAGDVKIEARWADPEELADLVNRHPNLCIKSISSGGHLITVTDNGPGIPPDQIADIWRPFFTTRREGTGLGLSIVRQIVQDHGGDIFVESRQGEGAVFTLVFPMTQAEEGDDDHGDDRSRGG